MPAWSRRRKYLLEGWVVSRVRVRAFKEIRQPRLAAVALFVLGRCCRLLAEQPTHCAGL
jgi:hypothetical protein